MKKTHVGPAVFLAALALAGWLVTPGLAGDFYWTGGTGDWNDPNNWGGTLPQCGDRAFINTGTALLAYGQAMPGSGSWSKVYVGYNGVGALQQSGGVMFNASNMHKLFLGYQSGSFGSYLLSQQGTLWVNEFYIGKAVHPSYKMQGGGQFNQEGGTVHLSWTTDAHVRIGKDGLYQMNSGSLVGPRVEITGGIFRQTGGSCSLHCCNNDDGVLVGYGGANPSFCEISGGTMSATMISVGKYSEEGTFRVIGNQAAISSYLYAQGSRGTLVSQVEAGGITTIDVVHSGSGYLPGEAYLDGTWQVQDAKAAYGRFDILTAEAGIKGAFDEVSLPGPEWTWGVDAGKTLWVEHVPEPATLSLLALGVAGLIVKRRRTVV